MKFLAICGITSLQPLHTFALPPLILFLWSASPVLLSHPKLSKLTSASTPLPPRKIVASSTLQSFCLLLLFTCHYTLQLPNQTPPYSFLSFLFMLCPEAEVEKGVLWALWVAPSHLWFPNPLPNSVAGTIPRSRVPKLWLWTTNGSQALFRWL